MFRKRKKDCRSRKAKHQPHPRPPPENSRCLRGGGNSAFSGQEVSKDGRQAKKKGRKRGTKKNAHAKGQPEKRKIHAGAGIQKNAHHNPHQASCKKAWTGKARPLMRCRVHIWLMGQRNRRRWQGSLADKTHTPRSPTRKKKEKAEPKKKSDVKRDEK